MLSGNILLTGGKKRDRSLWPRRSNGTFEKVRTESWDGSDWDDGWKNNKGYFMIYCPEYPLASRTGWGRRFHVVWWLSTGEIIQKGTVLHHKNENKLDDRLDNLEKMSHGEHSRHHSTKEPVEHICIGCGNKFYLPKWRGEKKFCSLQCYWKSPISKETRNKRSEGLKRSYIGRDSPMKGKSGPNQGRIFSEETRKNMSLAAIRRWSKQNA